jgi:hypothetical protein
MASFDDVPEKSLQGVRGTQEGSRGERDAGTSCMLRKRSSRLCYTDQGARSSTDRLHKRGTHNSDIASIYLYHPEDASAMFFEHVKFTRNMVGEEIAKGLAKFSKNSKYQPATFATTHLTAPSLSSTPSTSATPVRPPGSIWQWSDRLPSRSDRLPQEQRP